MGDIALDKRFFGKHQGEDIFLLGLKNEICKADFMNFGAALVRFKPFGCDIVGGFDTLQGYLTDNSYQGLTVGRVCNRIENAEFELDGAIYMLPSNDGDRGNCLHGGEGFGSKVWKTEHFDERSVCFSYYSEDGEDGFPAGLEVKVRYTLEGSALTIEYEAIPEAKTPIALTNHAFFNLDGFGGTVLSHTATIYADRYTKVNEKLIPTGERPSVVGTDFDFRKPCKIGERLSGEFDGYDHNFVLCPKIYKEFLEKPLGLAATVTNGSLELSVYTDQPCLQFYTGSFLGGDDFATGVFRGGIKPIKHGAFCLEAQTEPNCINRGEAIYDVGEIYRQTTVYEVKKV